MEVHRGKLPATVSVERTELLLCLCLNSMLETLDHLGSLVIRRQQSNPHEPALVVHHEQEVLVPLRRRWRDLAADVPVHQLQHPVDTILSLVHERRPPLLLG